MTPNQEKAIAIAIRFHFCNVEGLEMTVYDALQEADGDMLMMEFPFIAYDVFEHYDVDGMYHSVSNLSSDIERTFTI